MADGDSQVINYGPNKGRTKTIFDKAAGTGDIILHSPAATQKGRLSRVLLTIEGEAQCEIKEDGGETLAGPFNVVTGATTGVINLTDADGIEGNTAGADILLTRSASVGISGHVIADG